MKKKKLSSNSARALLNAASKAREEAYAPYSNFAVGAAVLTENGEVFAGCNIENASYGATICAERVAIFKAISAGHKSIRALAVIADHPDPIPPCGICRQVLSEFGPDADVLMVNTKGRTRKKNMRALMPIIFELPKGDTSRRK